MASQKSLLRSNLTIRAGLLGACLATVVSLQAAPGELDLSSELEKLQQQSIDEKTSVDLPADPPSSSALLPDESGSSSTSLFDEEEQVDVASGGVASDLPAALFRDFQLTVVARVVGRDRQAVVLRFTPLNQRSDQVVPINVLLTRKDSEPQPQRVNLAQGTRLVMELDPVDALGDTVSVTLRGEAILGQAFQQDRLSVAVD